MVTPLHEKVFLEINGTRQGMFLKSQDTTKPVLLFLHGGPGSPEIVIDQAFPTRLDELFTVCWWEQRGAGLSFKASLPAETMTLDQFIDDTIAVTHFLRQRFGQEKIYVLGHSWGSLLGVLVASRAPELFHAYIGTGQVVRQAESERLAYNYMIDEFRAKGDSAMLRRLERHPINDDAAIDMSYMMLRTAAMDRLGIGAMRQRLSMGRFARLILRFRGYTLREKLNMVRGSQFSIHWLLRALLEADVPARVPRLEIPAYILQGVYDYQVSYALARDYAQALEAPVKGFYSFTDSAHSPVFEQPELARNILREDVLRGRTDLAD